MNQDKSVTEYYKSCYNDTNIIHYEYYLQNYTRGRMAKFMFKTALLRLETYGMKGIKNPVAFDFYSRKTLSNFNLNEDRVRVLYGPNGVGKTSVVLSMWMLKNIFQSSNFLASFGKTYFDRMINKDAKKVGITLYYAASKDSKEYCGYHYSIELGLEDNSLCIEKECLERLSGKRFNGKYDTVFKTEKGKLLLLNGTYSPSFIRDFKEFSFNLSKNRSLLNLFLSYVIKNDKDNTFIQNISCDKDNFALYSCISFLSSIHVSVDSMDIHPDVIESSKDMISFLSHSSKEELIAPILDPLHREDHYSIFVPKRDVESFRTFVKRQASFIRIFKPDLFDIKIDETEANDSVRCRKIFVYKDYEIDFEFESTGIKKLGNLFSYLEAASNGGCVFVDELDGNVSGVYLRKIVEYMNHYGKGQLFFTAHSLDPMYPLCANRDSIYFMGRDNEISSWKKNGHYKPYILYPEGMVPGIEFNIDSFDFLSCFQSDLED